MLPFTLVKYFKTYRIDNRISSQIERNIRYTSINRFNDLDFKLSSFYTGEKGKCFLGLEDKESIKIVRIRTPLEMILPKIIVRFEKKDCTVYKIRYSVFAFLFFWFFMIAITLNLFYSIMNGHFEMDLVEVIIVFIGFCVLSLLEIKLTRDRINSCILSNKFYK